MQRTKSTIQDFNDNKTMIRLASISLDATKQPIVVKFPKRFTMEDKSIEQSRKELKQNVTVDSISTVANRGIPLARTTPLVTQEKIDDYRKNMSKPVTINGEKYLYSPADAITLEDYIQPEHQFDDIQLKEVYEVIKKITEAIKDSELLLKNLVKERKELNDEINLGTDSFESWIDKLDENQKEYTAVESDIKAGVDGIAQMNQYISQHKINEQINQKEKDRVATVNKGMIADYQGQLKEMNRGSFLAIQQQPSESEEDYLLRLQQVAETKYDDAIDSQQANLFNIKRLKDNLKSIIRDESDIEKVVNTFTEQDIYQINKVWKIILEKFMKLYGAYNVNVKVDDITDFLGNMLLEGKHGGVKNRGLDSDDDEYPVNRNSIGRNTPGRLPRKPVGELNEMSSSGDDPTGNSKFKVNLNNNACEVINTGTGTSFFLKISRLNNILVSLTGFEGEYIVAGKSGGEKIGHGRLISWLGNYTGVFNTINDRNIYSEVFANNTTKKDIYNHLESLGLQPVREKGREIRTKQGDTAIIKGWGVSLEIPRGLVDFGKIKLNLYKLYYDNTLVVKKRSGGNILGLLNTRVSDNLVNTIMAIVKKEHPPQQSLKNLNGAEREIYDLLMTMSGIHRSKHYTGDDKPHINRLKDRLELLEAEIMAGNNNASLLEELRVILLKLHHFKTITITEAKRHFGAIKKSYF